ncbi:MAG TPA: hypothetical protein VLW75_03675 [Rhizomicrobium sp.]|nr:hypothetical protein [Rhizomicrobium sp.]
MTSEIAVMNQRAVALAADSAVTLIDGGTVVVRNEQRKLFNLIEGRPIGLMFFGVADMLGHPWDHLIEHYQKTQKPDAFAHLRDCAVHFTNALDHMDELFAGKRQQDDYKRLLASVFRYVFNFAQYLRDSGAGAGDDTAVLEHAIDTIWRDYQFRPDGTPRPDLSCFPAEFGKRVLSEHGKMIAELIQYGFAPFGLSHQSQARLQDIAVFCVVKDLFLEDVSGLVFAGFGAEDRYPALVTYFVSAIVCGVVKRAEASHDVIDTEHRSRIRVFADSEVTNAFIRGIDYNLERRLYGGFRMMMHGLVDQLVGAFPGADPSTRETVRQKFQNDFVPRYFEAFHQAISQYQQQAFINPVLRVLEIAGRTELGDTARQLVGLNVFKKRITAQKETVGGAIDVAIITRENGFTWHAKGG